MNEKNCIAFFRVVDMDGKLGKVSIRNPKGGKSDPPKEFTFDSVYDWK